MGYVFPPEYANWAVKEVVKKDSTPKMMQVKLLNTPEDFNGIVEFEVVTNITKDSKHSFTFTLWDVDSILSDSPDTNTDSFLGQTTFKVKDKNVFKFLLTEEMRNKAFADIEFGSAECYIQVSHPDAESVYSRVFKVSKNRIGKKSGNGPCDPVLVKKLVLSDKERAIFLATLWGETWGEIELKEVAWVYYNLIQKYGFNSGMANSYFYLHGPKDPYGLYKSILYYLGEGPEYENDPVKTGGTIKTYIKGPFFKDVVIPRLKRQMEFVDSKVLIEKPKTCIQGWFGQGYWGDMNIRFKADWTRVWAMATMYYNLQQTNKAHKILVKEYNAFNYKGQNITTFIFDRDSILLYFEQEHPNIMPENYFDIPQMLYYDKIPD